MKEIEDFKKFIYSVIGLSRYKYISVINSLNAFSHSLEVLNHNIDLAYSLLIYSIESLSQNFDKYAPTWSDYDQSTKDNLEDCFKKYSINDDASNEICSILLKSSNLKLNKRFVDFASKHVLDDFFYKEAIGIKWALKKSELPMALKNAYAMRSKYVHQLKPIQDHLRHPKLAEGDVFYWEKKPYLTFRGLVRLSYHIIYNFISSQEYIEKEDYNWRSDLPGIINMVVAPIYWIWKIDGFHISQVPKRFAGLLENIIEVMSTPGPIVDLRMLLAKYETLLPAAEETYKISMIATYYLYNVFIGDECKMPNYLEILNQYEYLLNKCSIEMMAIYLLTNQEFPWEINECISCYNDYEKRKYLKNALSIHSLLEVGIIIKIAYKYLHIGKTSEFENWLNLAIFELPGKPELQKLLIDSKMDKTTIDFRMLLGLKSDKSDSAS
jgi:hypothetical protein